jgi:hypothetical protein
MVVIVYEVVELERGLDRVAAVLLEVDRIGDRQGLAPRHRVALDIGESRFDRVDALGERPGGGDLHRPADVSVREVAHGRPGRPGPHLIDRLGHPLPGHRIKEHLLDLVGLGRGRHDAVDRVAPSGATAGDRHEFVAYVRRGDDMRR